MKISVIVPAYDDLVGVLTCLNSLQATQVTREVEYLVQDDASPKTNLMATVPLAVAQVARNVSNLGFAGNCNAGAARATGDVLFFINQDVYAVYDWSVGWDARLVEAFAAPTPSGEIGVVGVRLLFPDAKVQSAGGGFDGRRQPYHRCLGWENAHHPAVSEPCFVAWATGAALAVRREVFQAVGGFDEVYAGGYFEDVDLCLKVRQAGHHVRYTPEVTLIHRVGSTGGNPRFMANAAIFRERWYHEIEPDIYAIKENWW